MNTYTKTEKNAYFFGMLGQNMLYTVIGTGLAYYFQSVIFLPSMAISAIFLLSKIFDAIKDPIIGNLIDRTHSKWGKCRPYLIFSPIAVCLFSVLLFINGTYTSQNSLRVKIFIIVWAAVIYFFWGLAFTFADVPLWTLPSLMTENEHDRNKLMALARIAAAIGAGLVSVLIIPISQALGNVFSVKTGDNEKGLKTGVIVVAVVLIIIGTVIFQSAGLFSKERVKQVNNNSISLKESFRIMWECKPFRKLMLSGLLRSPSMLMGVVQMTLFTYYFGDNGRMSYIQYFLLLGGGNVAGVFLATFITPKIIEKTEKHKLYNIFSIVFAVPFLSIFILYILYPSELNMPLQLSAFFILMSIAGFGQGVLSVLHSIMTADAVDYHEYHTGHRPDGVFFSGQTLLLKISTGISSAISGIVYAIAGFSGDGVKTVNKLLYDGASFKSDPIFAKYRFVIFFLFSIPAALGILLSILPMRKYPLSDTQHKQILEELIKKKNL